MNFDTRPLTACACQFDNVRGTHVSSVGDVREGVPRHGTVLDDDEEDTQGGRQEECADEAHANCHQHDDGRNDSNRLEHELRLAPEAAEC